jgi:hypothetical protein
MGRNQSAKVVYPEPFDIRGIKKTTVSGAIDSNASRVRTILIPGH